jgi:hypothetical protein
MGAVRRVGLVLGAVLCTGCLYYDSRWGESTAEQKRAASRLAPGTITASRGPGDEVRRTATVRACATRGYVAETLQWEDRFDELVRTANSVLEPDLGLTLKNVGATAWEPSPGVGDLSTIISELPSCEGADADWVVALVQSTPGVVTDFHVLGKGQTYSPYFALRAPNDPAEMDGLTKGLPDLDRATIEKLYSDRKRHKVLTLFLHELAHTLGAVHRVAKDTIMSPMYDAAEHGYDEPTLALMRLGLSIRLDKAKRYTEARQFLEKHADGFVEVERGAQMSMLIEWERSAAPTPSPDSPSTAEPELESSRHVESLPFESLIKQERQAYDAAVRLESKDPTQAWEKAKDLFVAHPQVREVQELRCRLAKERRLFDVVVQAHCAPLAALGPAP